MAEKKITIKLVVDKERSKLMFSECDKDFVDVLCSYLTLPIGTIIRLANKQSQLGSMDNLYQSVEALESEYLQTDNCKKLLLSPRSAAQNIYRNLAVYTGFTTDDHFTYYMCSSWTCSTTGHRLISMFENAKCFCGEKMDEVVWVERGTNAERDELSGVFVKGIRKFILSDDLIVREVSAETSLSIFFKLGIEDGTVLEERTVSVGTSEVLKLLMCSLISKTPMTDVLVEQKQIITNVIKTEEVHVKSKLSESQADTKKVLLNLLIRKSNNKVLYAVAKEDFVDLLFSFLAFPIGSIVNLLGGYSCLGSMDTLFKSVKRLSRKNPGSFQKCMDVLLCPMVACHHGCENETLQVQEQDSGEISVFACSTCFADDAYYGCRHGLDMVNLCLINPKFSDTVVGKGEGYVKKSTLFMVTDELKVEPLSLISTISFVNKLGVSFRDLEERTVSVGEHEALSILKSSLTSRTVLTDHLIRDANKEALATKFLVKKEVDPATP